jgi:hypothetical protein
MGSALGSTGCVPELLDEPKLLPKLLAEPKPLGFDVPPIPDVLDPVVKPLLALATDAAELPKPGAPGICKFCGGFRLPISCPFAPT